MGHFWELGLTGFIVAIGFLLMFRPLAVRVGLVDRPHGRKMHVGDVPLIGGVALLFTMLFGWLAVQVDWPGWLPAFLVASAAIMSIGVLDDRFDMKRTLRIPAQVGCALIIVYAGGLELTSLGDLFGGGAVMLGGMGALFTVVCIVGVMNSANLLDGANGLAAGVCLVAFLTFMTAAAVVGAVGTEYALALLIGALSAFFMFNFRSRRELPALAFLGDAGSLFLGLTLAVVAIHLTQRAGTHMAPMSAVWIAGVLILDTLSLMLRRTAHCRNPFSADRRHLHHLLTALGLHERHAVASIWGVQIIFSVVGMSFWLGNVPEWVMLTAFVAVFAAYTVGAEVVWHRIERRERALEQAMAASSEPEGMRQAA